MHYLFLDSTLGLTVGLLDSSFAWVELKNLESKKPSEIIHAEIFNLLKKYNLRWQDIECFATSGPGSYTGMRLSEGIVQILEFSGIPIYSFYHFEVPKLSGINKGFWITNAFKGQVFLYTWDEHTSQKELLNKEQFTIIENELGYTLDVQDPTFSQLQSSMNLIKINSATIFSKVHSQRQRVAPYYFRAIDEEFR